LTALFLGLGAVALLVGAWASQRDGHLCARRRPEIACERALGATRAHIAVQFLGESVLLSLLAVAPASGSAPAATAGYASLPGMGPSSCPCSRSAVASPSRWHSGRSPAVPGDARSAARTRRPRCAASSAAVSYGASGSSTFES